MDITCPRCGEKWDNDEIHDRVEELSQYGVVTNYDELAGLFRRQGCAALDGTPIEKDGKKLVIQGELCERTDTLAADAASAMYDLLGDDMDGASAMLEDLGL